MLDPLIATAISLFFAALFGAAALHKLSGLRVFRAVLADYQLLPASLNPSAAIMLPTVELALALGWLVAAEARLFVACATAALLLAYAAAMGINLGRGRAYISCGCAFGAGDSLSWLHVIRNGALGLVAAVAALPTYDRGLLWLDYVTLAGAGLVALLLYQTVEILARNKAALGEWTSRG